MPGGRFPRTVRLLKPAQFQRVFKTGIRSKDPLFMIVAATRVVSEKASNGALNARVGLAISKKVDKRAVVRNRIKRQVRESFRQHLQELPPADFVVMANAAAADASGARIRDSLNAHWQRLARRLDGSQGHEKR